MFEFRDLMLDVPTLQKVVQYGMALIEKLIIYALIITDAD